MTGSYLSLYSLDLAHNVGLINRDQIEKKSGDLWFTGKKRDFIWSKSMLRIQQDPRGRGMEEQKSKENLEQDTWSHSTNQENGVE